MAAGLDGVLRYDPKRGREDSRTFLWADYALGLTALVANAEILVAGAC